jgi:hypothetical protein
MQRGDEIFDGERILPRMKRSVSSRAATTVLLRHSSVASPTPSIPASV